MTRWVGRTPSPMAFAPSEMGGGAVMSSGDRNLGSLCAPAFLLSLSTVIVLAMHYECSGSAQPLSLAFLDGAGPWGHRAKYIKVH